MENNNKIKKLIKEANELRWQLGGDFHDKLTESIYADAAKISNATVKISNKNFSNIDIKIDKIVTSKIFGFPIMLFLFSLVLWITIVGANYPSQFLSFILLDKCLPLLHNIANYLNAPYLISSFLIDGVFLAVAWVVAVMLPPMAIFFPLFTLFEDFGYLPRVAFNLDNIFRKAGSHGKQALTMTMGFGCNAAGVVSTRIIDSPRERLIAIITNNFSLCNGRWPTQIIVATIFIGAIAPESYTNIIPIASVILIALTGIGFMFIVSWMLSKTILKGEVSTFNLELPPYRPPKFWQVIYTSLIDRTLVVLWRAVVFAAPAGALIWLISNVSIDNETIAHWLINNFNDFGLIFGLNGVIILAYIVAIPANEIVMPTILMLTVLVSNITGVGEGNGVLFEANSLNETATILKYGGWTLLTAINLMIFSLLHNPCSTTIYTIYKETKSIKWTLIATLLPIILGFIVTFCVTQLFKAL